MWVTFGSRGGRKIGGENATPMTWEYFIGAFLYKFFPRELREAKAHEFINLRQGSMLVQEYELKFTQFFRYAPFFCRFQGTNR